jgi:HemY protein
MKRRLSIVLLLVVALAAVVAGAWLGPRLLENPGFVLIEIGGWRVQTSLVVLIGAVLGAWLLASLALALLRMPGRAVRAARDARERRNLDRGLLALSEGDWSGAERALGRALRRGRGMTAGYLAAARAAQGQAAPERREEYLALADTRFGRRHFATMLVRARLLASEGEPERAVEMLEQLHLKRPRHQGVLRMLLEAYQQCGRWRDVRLLLPAVRKADIVSRERAEQLAHLAAARELEAAADIGELQAIRKSLRAAVADHHEVVAAFARRALELDRAEEAESPLRRAIEIEPRPELLALYAQSEAGDRRARIKACQRWLSAHGDSAALHLALGRLYLDEREDDKAREHLQVAVRHSPDPAAYAALGRVLDRAGLLESAAQCYRNALRLEQGRAPEPLPPAERPEADEAQRTQDGRREAADGS